MTQDIRTRIKEIFTSIQGEGLYVGVNQLFIRFCKCNLKCEYCDTDFLDGEVYTPEKLLKEIEPMLLNVHSISLTGGEPLCDVAFLREFLPILDKKIYLETNATMYDEFLEIVDNVDIVSADIKIPSSSKLKPLWDSHDKFFKICKEHNKEIFAKIVFNEYMTDDEIQKCLELGTKYNVQLILQPQTANDKVIISKTKTLEIFNKFLAKNNFTRIIPQVHKFIGVR